MAVPAELTPVTQTASESGTAKRREALIVGVNGATQSVYLSPLRAAEADALAIGHTLQSEVGDPFHVTLLLGEQATAADVRKVLGRLKRDCTLSVELLFYFSGHALPLRLPDGRVETFFCTSDFEDEDVRDDPGRFFSMGWLYEYLYEARDPGSVLIMLDCCYAGNMVGASSDPLNIDMRRVITHYKERSDRLAHAAYSNRLRFILAATGHSQQAAEQAGHGLLTRYILQVLKGQAAEALGDGLVTPDMLMNYAQRQMPGEQQPSSISINHRLFVVADHRDRLAEACQRQAIAREQHLQALLHDHLSFMADRLASFVGRVQELADIRMRIAEQLACGGYVTITGQAGQGKSSVIAKLVHEYGPGNVAHHFIPFNPGPDHQVGLLRNLMARLILKYDLAEIYVSSDSRPALRDYFPRVLAEVVAHGGQEVIFIDGLDQLEEDPSGRRDLSFLPVEPPEGIVFVLGTRPDDTLQPLTLLKPRDEYRLPNLSRGDFDLILQHYGVMLDSAQAEQFYSAMGQNALYLDLVAKELKALAGLNALRPEETIRRLADNPDNLFSLAMNRLKRNHRQWREVIKPLLGVLLAAREPLALRPIRQLIGQDDDSVRDGLQRLGGLLAREGRDRYYLYHLKLHDYLRQDPQLPEKLYVFANDEEEGWHQRLATWCAGGHGGLAAIWEDAPGNAAEQDRRAYAREHYIAHLSLAKDWEALWEVLDAGDYGRAKLRHDPGTRSYVLDLDLGRQAAARPDLSPAEALALLPTLWRYSLLRCSLVSQADNYNLVIFEDLVMVGRQREAIGLVELMTEASRKATMLAFLAHQLVRRAGDLQEGQQLLTRAIEVARTVEDVEQRIAVEGGIAGLALLSGLGEQARALLDDLMPMVEGIRNVDTQAGWLLGIGTLAILSRRTEGVHHILDTVRRRSAAIPDWKMQVLLLLGVATLEVLEGHTEQANTVLNDARAAIPREADDPVARVWRSLGVAAVTVLSGQHERADDLLLELFSTIEAMASDKQNSNVDSDTSVLLPLCMAAIYWLNHEPERASCILQNVMLRMRQISDLEKAESLARDLMDALLVPGGYIRKYLLQDDLTGPTVQIWEIPALAQLRTLLQALVSRCQLPTCVVATLEALARLLPSPEALERADCLRRLLAMLYAQGGMVDRAITIATAIHESSVRVATWISIASYLTDSETVEQTRTLAARALESAQQASDASERARHMADIAWELLHRGAVTMSQPILDAAIATARLIVEDREAAIMLKRMANALRRAGRHDDALVVLERAATVARAIGDASARAVALHELAITYLYEGHEQAAIALLRDAITAARAIINSPSGQRHLLRTISSMLYVLTKNNEAAWVAGDIELESLAAMAFHDVIRAMIQQGRIDDAWATAVLMPAYGRQIALRDVAHAFVQAERVGDLLKVVMSAPPDDQAAILAQVAVSLVSSGRLHEVLAIARWEEMHPLKALLLDQIAHSLATAEDLDGALALIDATLTNAERSPLLLRLSTSLADIARFEAAHQVLAQVGDTPCTQVLRRIAAGLAQAGRVDKALAILTQANCDQPGAHETRRDLESLIEIGDLLARHGRREQAQALFHHVADAVHSFNVDDQVAVLLGMARACLEANWLTDVRRLLDQVLAEVSTSNSLSLERQLQLAVTLAQAGWQREASSFFQQVLSDAHSLVTEPERSRATSSIAVALVDAERLDEALAVAREIPRDDLREEVLETVAIRYALAMRIEEAINLARAFRSSYRRDNVLEQIACVYGSSGHGDDALSIISTLDNDRREKALQAVIDASMKTESLDKVSAAVGVVEDCTLRAMAHLWLAKAAAQMERLEHACMHLEAARSASSELDAYSRSALLCDVTTVYLTGGRLDEALGIIREMVRSASPEHGYRRQHILRKVVTLYVRAGRLEDALEIVHALDSPGERVASLQEIAGACAQVEPPELVLRLIQTPWVQASERSRLVELARLADALIDAHPELALALGKAFTWVDDILRK